MAFRPHADATALALVVPCVVVAEITESTTIDLRTLPADVQLGPYRVHVVRTEVSPDSPPRTRIVFDLPSLPGSRQLLGPGNVRAQGMRSDLSQRGVPDAQGRMWLDTVVLEEPVITATTALVRVDGPWRFPLST